jgi:integrase
LAQKNIKTSTVYPYYHIMSKFRVKPLKWGNNNWRVDGWLNNERIRKGFETKAQAIAYREQMEIECMNHGQKLANLSTDDRSDVLWYKEQLAPLGNVSIREVVAEYVARHDKRSRSVPVREAVGVFNSDMERRLKNEEVTSHYVRDWRSVSKLFVSHFGNTPLCDVSAPVFQDWLNSLPYSPKTRANYRLRLGVFFTFATPRWIDSNPIKGVKAPKVFRKTPEILTPEEASKLLLAASYEILPHLAIGLFAGVRVEEIGRLTWSSVRWDENLIVLGSEFTKTNNRRTIPISKNLSEWLQPYRFASGPIAPPDKERHLVNAWKAAGITRKQNALRHSFCSYRVAQTRNAGTTAYEAGNSVAVMQRHYVELVTLQDADRYFGICPTQADNIRKIA